jgi:ankyrin repeat protein
MMDNKVNINTQDKNGLTQLHIAVDNDFIKVVVLLLKAGANPNIEDSYGNSPFLYAARNSNIEMMNLLIDTGKLELNFLDNNKPSPLYFASYYGHNNIVDRLITGDHSGDKMDINHQDKNGYTQLHLAVKNGHLKVIATLLKAGADPNITNVNKLSPFDLAKQANNKEILDLFDKLQLQTPRFLR